MFFPSFVTIFTRTLSPTRRSAKTLASSTCIIPSLPFSSLTAKVFAFVSIFEIVPLCSIGISAETTDARTTRSVTASAPSPLIVLLPSVSERHEAVRHLDELGQVSQAGDLHVGNGDLGRDPP